MTEKTASSETNSPFSPRQRTELPALTGSRFIAALAVVLCHEISFTNAPNWLNNFFHNGFLAVPFFFVLSGFILAYNYADAARLRGRLDYRDFIVARLARIYPIYLFGILLNVPISTRALLALNGHDIRFVAVLQSIAAIFSLTLTQAWMLIQPISASLNQPGWSLSVEFFFYLLFPVLVVFTCKLKQRDAIALIVGCFIADELIARLVSSLPKSGSLLGLRGELIYSFHPLTRLPSFVMGVGAAQVLFGREDRTDSLLDRRIIPLISWIGFLALAAIALICGMDKLSEQITPGTIHMNVLFTVVVAAFAVGRGAWITPMALPFMITLGEASYSLYILHMPWWSYFQQLFCNVFRLGTVDSACFKIGYLVSVVALSLVAWRWIERPSRSWLKTRFSLRQNNRLNPASLASEPM